VIRGLAGIVAALTACAIACQGAPPLPEVAPYAYFSKRCARCHGPNGSNFGTEFGKGITDAQLVRVVREMTEGPGGEPLRGVDLDALVAWHRALIRREPFLVLLRRGSGAWSGECTPGAQVVALDGARRVSAKVVGSRWSLTPRASARIILEVRFAGRTTRLDPALRSFSHHEPLGTNPQASDDPQKSWRRTETATGSVVSR
jgi:hypothetical protein